MTQEGVIFANVLPAPQAEPDVLAGTVCEGGVRRQAFRGRPLSKLEYAKCT